MQKKLYCKIFVIGIICLFIGVGVIPSTGRMVRNSYKLASNYIISEEGAIEYWALIFAVGIYYKHPDQDRPFMLTAAADLYEVLLNSPQWQADHIHKITAELATGLRLLKELDWLNKNVDNNDLVLVYITTHGIPLKHNGQPLDYPPRDEADGSDECLVMYHGFEIWYGLIWDDLLNFYLSRIRAKGLCLIVDSCHSGGFNDTIFFYKSRSKNYNVESFVQGFAYELSAKNRVVLMSCEEDELSYGGDFSEYLIDGFWGRADFYGNKDGINSAEEAFKFAEFRMKNRQHPTILDLYPGEFPVTYTQT